MVYRTRVAWVRNKGHSMEVRMALVRQEKDAAEHYLSRGKHECEIQLSRESTTTHWLLEMRVETLEIP